LSVEFPKYSILGSRPLTGYTVANFSFDHGKEGFELGEARKGPQGSAVLTI